MKKYFSMVLGLWFFLCVSNCGLSTPPVGSGSASHFYVLSVDPETNSAVNEVSAVRLVFSEPVLASSITSNTLFVLHKTDYDSYLASDWKDLFSDIEDGDVAVISAEIQVNEEDNSVHLVFQEELSTGQEYVVVALPKIQSQDYFPLDQTGAGSSDKSFASFFSVTSNALSPLSPASSDENPVSVSQSTYPQVTNSETSAEENNVLVEETVTENASETETGETTETTLAEVSSSSETSFDWSRVLITEIVTDPQQDHSESSAGNDVVFDAVSGTGTVSSSDEYIEIFNGTSESINLTGWSVTMTDGTDETALLVEDNWDSFFSDQGDFEKLGAGEFVVLGNPPGALNNTIQIDLFNETGDLIDSVVVDDANATDSSDEAYFLSPDGNWMMGEASPGYFPDAETL